MTPENEVDLERGASRVQSILHNPAPAVEETEVSTNGIVAAHTAELATEARERATRRDKGSVRVYIEVPGVRYDLTEEAGREALLSYVQLDLSEVTEPSGARLSEVFAALLKEIGRLAAKAKS